MKIWPLLFFLQMCHILSENRVTYSVSAPRCVSPDCKMCVRDTNMGKLSTILYILVAKYASCSCWHMTKRILILILFAIRNNDVRLLFHWCEGIECKIRYSLILNRLERKYFYFFSCGLMNYSITCYRKNAKTSYANERTEVFVY